LVEILTPFAASYAVSLRPTKTFTLLFHINGQIILPVMGILQTNRLASRKKQIHLFDDTLLRPYNLKRQADWAAQSTGIIIIPTLSFRDYQKESISRWMLHK